MYYHPNSVQNIITTQPSCMYSANNNVTYFRRLEDFEVYRKVYCFLYMNQYFTKISLKTCKTHKLSM